MATIMVVDDEPVIIDSLYYSLGKEGYRVMIARDGIEALQVFDQSFPDLVVLDIMLPKLDGLEVCKQLRTKSSVPIIMLTAKGEEMDRVIGLEIGADDYIPKPFSFRELLARIRAHLRRIELDQKEEIDSSLEFGSLYLDRSSRRVFKNHQEIMVAAKEYDILLLLMVSAGRAVSREEILTNVWGKDFKGDQRTLEVHIRWLRMKIEDDPTNPRFIQTVRGYGYRFISPDELG